MTQNTIGPAALAKAAAAEKAKAAKTEETGPTKSEESAPEMKTVECKMFQFPSAPTMFKFPWEKERTPVVDGVYRCPVSEEHKLAHLQKMVDARIITPYEPRSEVPRQQIPPKPVQTLLEDN